MSDYIPLELISNILFRLPIADVLRSTSVCKSWYQLITSPSFIYLHLNSSISNTQSRILIGYVTGNDCFKEVYHLHSDNQGFEEIQELKLPPNSDTHCFRCGPSHGVFLFGDIRDRKIPVVLSLWNPALRKSMILPKLKHPHLLPRQRQDYTFGFGFLPSTDNFKVVTVMYTRFSYSDFIVPPQVEIYEFYTRSWRDADASELSYVLEHYSYQALLKGIIHWLARDQPRVEGSCTYGGLIVTFDLTSEKFGTLLLPKCMQTVDRPYFLELRSWKESLWLLNNSSIFIMKEYGIINSWEKMFTLDFHEFKPLYIRENGEILAVDDYEGYDEFWRFVSCDPKTNEIMDLGVHGDGPEFCSTYAYVDSLFLIKDTNESNGDRG